MVLWKPAEMFKTVMALVENCEPISVVIHGLFWAFRDHLDSEVWVVHNYRVFNYNPLP